MKWDITAERKLAILAIQQHKTQKYNAQTIINNWPGDPKPTLRAVNERLAMLKKKDLNAETSATQDSVEPTTPADPGPNITIAAPDPEAVNPKPKAKANPINQSTGSKSEGFKKRLNKRKHKEVEDDEEDDEDEDLVVDATPTRSKTKKV